MSLLSDIGTAIKNKLGGTSVDNTVPRYDGTTCKLQGSGVTISDTNEVIASGGFIGNASTATLASDSNKLIGKNWLWSGQAGQPVWVWGGNDGTNMYVWNPANFTVANATNTIGYGQSWQDVTASRALGVAYTNSTEKPILVDVTISHNAGGSGATYVVNGVAIGNTFDDGTRKHVVSFIVPNGHSYYVTQTSGAISMIRWAELR